MNRTINEKKAFKGIIIGLIGFWISAIGLSLTPKESVITTLVFWIGIWLTMLFIALNSYALGWEYQRINMEEEQDE